MERDRTTRQKQYGVVKSTKCYTVGKKKKKYQFLVSTTSFCHKLNLDPEECWGFGTRVRRNGQHFKPWDSRGHDGLQYVGLLRREDAGGRSQSDRVGL